MKLRAAFLGLLVAGLVLATVPASAQDACQSVAGNLVVNCGFETGDFTGWTQGGNTGFTGVNSGQQFSGSFSAFLGPIGSDGTLTQFVGDNSNVYFVSFELSNDGGTPNDFTVFWNGVDVGPGLVYSGPMPYTLFSGCLAGNFGPGSNQLTFQFRQDPAFWHLDSIVVTNANAVPEPGSLALMGSGLIGLAGVIRRKLIG